MTLAAPWALLLLVPWCVAAFLLASRANTTRPVPFVTLWKSSSPPGPQLAGKTLPAAWLVALLASTLMLIAAASGPGLSTTAEPPAIASDSKASDTVSPLPLAHTLLLNEAATPWSYRRLSHLLNQQLSPPGRTVTIGTAHPADLLVPTPDSRSTTLPSSSDLLLTDHPAARAMDFTRLPPDTKVAQPPAGFSPIVSLAGIPLVSISPDRQQIHIGLHGATFEQSADFVVLFLECARAVGSNAQPSLSHHPTTQQPPPHPRSTSPAVPPGRQLSAHLTIIGLCGTLLASLLYRRACRIPASS